MLESRHRLRDGEVGTRLAHNQEIGVCNSTSRYQTSVKPFMDVIGSVIHLWKVWVRIPLEGLIEVCKAGRTCYAAG